MNDPEDQVPGLTFLHRGSERYKTGNIEKAKLTLECEIHNEALWEEVLAKFKEGYRVHARIDFHGEVISAMRTLIEKQKMDVAKLESDLRRKEEELTETKGQLAKYTGVFSSFGRQLRGGQGG